MAISLPSMFDACARLNSRQHEAVMNILVARENYEDRDQRVISGLYHAFALMAAHAGDSRLYFIEAPSARLMKIGHSVDPLRRLESLRLLAPVPLQIRGVVPGGRELERLLHDHFRYLRSHGEWFFTAPALTEFCDIACAFDHQGAEREGAL